MNSSSNNKSPESVTPIDWWIVATVVACVWLGLAWAVTLLNSISNSKYIPITPSWEIITEQSSNSKKVIVILDQIITLQDEWVDLSKCFIRDGVVIVSDLWIQDTWLQMRVELSRKTWFQYADINDKNLDWEIDSDRVQSIYDVWLNTLIDTDIVKKCSK